VFPDIFKRVFGGRLTTARACFVRATNVEVTGSEAKGFGPIDECYKKDLQKINQRLVNLLET
jgi:hypothetical protein